MNCPKECSKKHGNMTLAVDIMYINEIPFVITTSGAIHFGTTELIKNKKNINNNDCPKTSNRCI